MTDEQMRDLVKECGLDWHRGYMPIFDGDPTNRYSVLIEAVEDSERQRLLDVAKMLQTCAWALRRGTSPDLGERALELLKRLDLLGSPLRA